MKEDAMTYAMPKQQGPVKTYVGSKIILAEPMDECSFLREKGKDVENQETAPGYKVTYPDGYESWSPKSVFEEAYREVNIGEINMAKNQVTG